MTEERQSLTEDRFWRHVLTHWDDVSNDLHEVYHLDSLLPEFWERPWWNTRVRILGLLDTKSRLAESIKRL